MVEKEGRAAPFPRACRKPGRSTGDEDVPMPWGARPQLTGLWAFLAMAALKGTMVSHGSRWQHRLLSLQWAHS